MDSDVQSDSTSSLDESGDSADENDFSETCCFNKRVLQLPECFCSEEDVFKEVLSPGTWKSVLNSKHGERLKALLPVFPENDEKEKNETLRKLIDGENFKFGNPFKHFFSKLKDGFLSSDVVEITNALKMANYREYKNQLQQYSYHLLQDILMSRKKLIDAAYNLPPDQPVKMLQFIAKPKDATLLERTRLRYFSTLQDIREELNALDTSSEDENYPESHAPKVCRKYKKHQQSHDIPLSNEWSKISATTSYPPGCFGYGQLYNQCNEMFEVSEERYREMLLNHKERIISDPKNPKLMTSHLELREITARSNFGKRQKSAENHSRKKPKGLEGMDKSVNSIFLSDSIEGESSSTLFNREESSFNSSGPDTTCDIPPSVQETEVQTDPLTILEEEDSQAVFDAHHQGIRLPSPHPEVHQYPTCFFALLRDLFCESAEKKLSAVKLEEKVRNWQNGPTASLFEWLNYQESWSDLVSPALKFLAGDFINQLPDSFVPFLDYKEKQQQWQWIGSGRDSDDQLYLLCQQWLETKDDITSDILETCQGSPPPPRVTTGWTVRPTAEEEKKLYREQECIRYQNPHKAFTFKVHGYEAVVGPVKGVYGKESGINKAREHSLLTSDRPPFVTILSLVRDSAARLPNGEGTRADICELLKDSQYLAPASDQQIHTVVSGALDRLHYEKDPCVKYDVNRKLWIYLHRHRTEEEFERIHQAQAAAAKAKKAVQKGKFPKFKSKEIARAIAAAQVPHSESTPILSLDMSAPTFVSAVNVHSPRGGSTPRTQANSKLPPARFLIHHNMVAANHSDAKNTVLTPEHQSKNTEVSNDQVLDSAVDSKQAVASIIAAQSQEINISRQTMLGSNPQLCHSKSSVNNPKNLINTPKTAINNAKSTVSNMKFVCSTSKSMINSPKSTLSTVKASVSNIKAAVNAKNVVNKATITNQKNTIGNLRTTINNAKTSINSVKTTFTNIKTLNSIKTPINNVKATISNAKSSISNVKTTATNSTATQIVSVTPVQIKSIKTEPGLPVNVLSPSVHDVLNVDMKPSSPSYVGQPPVLQPILSHTSTETSGSHTNVTSTSPPLISSSSASVNKTKINCPNLSGFPGAITGFQTIVIKQEPGLRPCNGVSTIPLLSIEERLPATNPSAINSTPVVARLVHGSQYLSFCNIATNSTTCSSSKPITAAMQNFRVQGGNICQQVLSASTIKVINSTPVSAIADTRVPVLALKNQISPGKEPTLLTQSPTALNVCGRLYQMTNIRNAVLSKDISETKVDVCSKETPDSSENDAKDLNISHNLAIPTISYGSSVAVAGRNSHPILKVSPK